MLLKLDRDGYAVRVESSEPATSVHQIEFAPPPPPARYSSMEQLRRWVLTKTVEMPFHGATPAELQAWAASSS